MPRTVTYPNLALNGVVGPQTLAGASAQRTTNGIPCRNASYVSFRIRSTNGITPSVWAILMGNHNLRAHAYGATGYPSVAGNIGIRADQTLGGNSVCIGTPVGYVGIPHDFAFLQLTPNAGASPANDITGVTVDAEVTYSDDAYLQATEHGQFNYSVPTS